MKQILFIMSLLTAIFGSKALQNSEITLLSSDEFRNQIKGKNVQLVDVRTPREFKDGFIDDAININFFSGKFNVEFNKLDKDRAVYIYCRSGRRSKQASKKLATMGFSEIYDLKGGILKYH